MAFHQRSSKQSRNEWYVINWAKIKNMDVDDIFALMVREGMYAIASKQDAKKAIFDKVFTIKSRRLLISNFNLPLNSLYSSINYSLNL